jgi:hypothetical protein
LFKNKSKFTGDKVNKRNNIEHASISKVMKNLPSGVSDALDKVREFNEVEPIEEQKESIPEVRHLVLFGKIVEDLIVSGYKIRVSTLSNRQQKSLVKKLMKLDSEDRIADVKVMTLTEAVVSINELPLEDYYSEENSDLNVEQKRYEVISDLQSSLVNKLFDFYESLVLKSNKILTNGELKTEIKN